MSVGTRSSARHRGVMAAGASAGAAYASVPVDEASALRVLKSMILTNLRNLDAKILTNLRSKESY